MNRISEVVEAERPVRVVNGEVLHHPQCEVAHSVHPLAERPIYWKTHFELQVQYGGGRGDPRCWVISPSIPPDQRRHIWPDGSICPFMSVDAWDADENDVVDFMGHTAIWLLEWTAFSQTGVWLAREHHGTPDYHLKVLKSNDNCWCRSGRRYGTSHRRPTSISFETPCGCRRRNHLAAVTPVSVRRSGHRVAVAVYELTCPSDDGAIAVTERGRICFMHRNVISVMSSLCRTIAV